MALAGAWVAFPLVLTLVATGWGLLVEQVAGRRVPGALLPALGLASLAATFALTSSVEPELNLPILIAGATGGIGLCAIGSGPRDGLRSLRPNGPCAAAALGAYALFAAPIIFSGEPGVAGYLRLDDTTSLLALGDWVFEHGRSTEGLAPSTYEAVLELNLGGTRYPVGGMLPLVAVGRLGGQELMSLWMPYMAVLGALLALAIESILRPLAPDPRSRVPVAVLASGSALLVGYMQWGGLKEVWAAALAAVVAALVPWTIDATRGSRPTTIARAVAPMLVVTAGIVSALSVAGVVWVAPAFAVLVAGTAVQHGRSRLVPVLALAMAIGAAVLLLIVKQTAFVQEITIARSGSDWLGRLLEPLSPFQVLGIWPAEDFRVDPVATVPTALLLVAVCLGACWALVRATSRRDWGLLSYASVLAAAAVVLVASDWAWAEAKALAIASPVPLALAGAAACELLTRGARFRVAGGTLLAVIAVGVIWSDALAFRGTTLTPYERHEELVSINERFAGRGPTLITEFEPYASRWFIRALDPEGAGELRRRTVPLVGGGFVQAGKSADIDSFVLDGLDDYRLLVVRRSPLASRPPSSFTRVWRGRWYEVWERRSRGRQVLSHAGLGNALDPGAMPRCSDIRRLAASAGPGGILVAATPQRPVIGGLLPDGGLDSWSVEPGGAVLPSGRGEGSAYADVLLPAAGRYEVWLSGGFRGRAVVSVDGREVGGAQHELSYPGQTVPFGTADLTAGSHTVTVRLSSPALQPGTDGIDRFTIGPVVLVPADDAQQLIEVPPDRAERLCRQKLDWVEAAR